MYNIEVVRKTIFKEENKEMVIKTKFKGDNKNCQKY